MEYKKIPLTVLLRDVPLQPEETLIDVDTCHVSLPDEAEDEVVGEPGLGRLHLGEGGLEGLGGGNVAVLELERE